MKSENASLAVDPGARRLVGVMAKFPMLEAAEERDLARRWREQRDRTALDRIITSHLRQVAKIARSFAGYGLPLADLISVGTIGLIRAADGYDPDLGFRFSTYAAWWVRAEMREFVFDNWSLVRIAHNSANKRLFFKLRRLKSELKIIDDGDLPPAAVAQIAARLNVPAAAVEEMNRRLSGGEVSLNVAHGDDGEEWQDAIADGGEGAEATLGEHEELARWRHGLDQALTALSARERAIVVERHISDAPNTLDSLSVRFGISRERVRQIEARALEKLKASVARGTARAA